MIITARVQVSKELHDGTVHLPVYNVCDYQHVVDIYISPYRQQACARVARSSRGYIGINNQTKSLDLTLAYK